MTPVCSVALSGEALPAKAKNATVMYERARGLLRGVLARRFPVRLRAQWQMKRMVGAFVVAGVEACSFGFVRGHAPRQNMSA